MTIHFADLQSLYPSTPKDKLTAAVEPLNAAMKRFDISTPSRQAAFLAQAGHESGGFSTMVENLNYSQDGLRKIFKKYFPTDDLAKAYARQPQKIANKVYASRMGNGNEASGDGWKYRGRGAIQITGKFNYSNFAKAIEMSLEDTVAYLETTEGAFMSAAWFWATNGLNALADQGKFTAITQKINGGQNGSIDRQAHYEKAKKLLS